MDSKKTKEASWESHNDSTVALEKPANGNENRIKLFPTPDMALLLPLQKFGAFVSIIINPHGLHRGISILKAVLVHSQTMKKKKTERKRLELDRVETKNITKHYDGSGGVCDISQFRVVL